jgi:hypothetical protein
LAAETLLPGNAPVHGHGRLTACRWPSSFALVDARVRAQRADQPDGAWLLNAIKPMAINAMTRLSFTFDPPSNA